MIVADLAMAVALGGDCLADIAVLRAQPTLAGPVVSDPVVSRLVAALAGDAPRAVKAIRAARCWDPYNLAGMLHACPRLGPVARRARLPLQQHPPCCRGALTQARPPRISSPGSEFEGPS